MRRWIFHILAGISAALFLTSISLWVRSFQIMDNWERIVYSFTGPALGMKSLDIFSSGGAIYVSRVLIQMNDTFTTEDQRKAVMGQSGWQHVAGKKAISAEDYFVRKHGRPHVGFGYDSGTDVVPAVAPATIPEVQSYHRFLIPWALSSLIFLILPAFSASLHTPFPPQAAAGNGR
jgi:hypothetical protein